MQSKTYLNSSIKNGQLIRWCIMPLSVYIAPMNFYSKKGEDPIYRRMVMDALNAWVSASGGKFQYKITNVLLESHMNVDWKRVERTALGHCYTNYDASGRLCGAEVSIGLSDGIIHQKYMAENEVYHTILHEIGHGLGLGHSPYKTDIMYTPHQYGVTALSPNDVNSIRWLYTLPANMNVQDFCGKNGHPHSMNLDSVLYKIDSKSLQKDNQTASNAAPYGNRDLLSEAENIGDLKRYNMLIHQSVNLSSDLKKFINDRQRDNN